MSTGSSFNMKNIIKSKLAVFLLAALCAQPTLTYAEPDAPPAAAEQDLKKVTAYEVWNDLLEVSLTEKSIPLKVVGSDSTFSFGGEKEGSSSMIARVMGPDKAAFTSFVLSLTPENRVKFLSEFLTGISSGKILVKKVFDSTGKQIPLDLRGVTETNVSKLTPEDLQARFNLFLERAGDRSFSFIKPETRRAIAGGRFPGLDKKTSMTGENRRRFYMGFLPLYGDAERYLVNAHATSNGWEMNFKPQPNYGEFEGMITWFRKALSTNGALFEAPGHQWLVFPKRDASPEETAVLESRISETYKAIQAYVVLRGIEGKTNIEIGSHKQVHNDSDVTVNNNDRGVFRSQVDRFRTMDGRSAYNLELRAGTKSDSTRRFVEHALISRYAANDFEGLAAHSSWELIPPGYGTLLKTEPLVKRFGVTALEASRCIENLQTMGGNATKFRTISEGYFVPFWQWENAPYLAPEKVAQLKELTKTFIKNVAAMKKPRLENVQDALQLWAYTSNLSTDVGRYLAPAPQNDTPTVARLMKANPPRAGPDGVKGSAVDVDAIDLGIEYTARFPLKMKASYADKILPNNKKAWLSTDYDLTLEERQALIKRLATNLGKQLNGGTEVPVTAIENGGHGHSLVIVYQVKDAKGRDWRIEWDGVGRDYDPEGVILESGRGGHCEVVTPKFNPDAAEMQAVFRAFKATNMIPATEMGGGHINIDLAPFAGKPREIARFLAIFLENRGVVATMFQRIDRLKNGEPTEISSKLIERLKNFAGTEAELKQLLYNERYFNTRVGRKSRYIQLDLSAYFQDVIPSEFISPDFDLKNEVWRQTFRVDPKVRKAELRLMNAPRDEVESALQIKLVRAMLDFAFNQDTSLTGQVQKVDFEGSVKNPERALKEFAKTMARFGLDPAEFRPYFLDGLSSARYSVNSPNYQPLNVALSDHPKVAEWGVATQERSLADSLNSEDNPWSEKTHPKAVEQHAIRKTSQIEAQKLREAAAAKGVVSNLSRKAAEKFFVDRILGDPAIFDALSADQKLLALGELHSREDAKDFVTNALEKLKTSSDFSSALTNVLKRPGDTSPEGARWLAGLIQPGEPFKVAQGAAIRHADAEVRNLGYKALGNLRGKGVLTILSSVFEKWGPSPAEPAAMGDALLRLSAVNLGKTKSFDPANLVTSIASQIPNLSAESLAYATVLFHNLQGPGVVVGVKAFLAHEDPAVRRMGVSALEGHYDGESLQLARELKNDMDPKIRALAKLTLLDQKKALSSISDSELQILETTDALDVLLRRKETKKGFKIRLALLEKRKDFPQAIDQFFKKHTADPRTEPELLVPFAQTLKTGFSAASYAIASKSSKVRAEGYRALMAESDANTLAASLLSAFSKIVPGDRNVAADYLAHSKDIDFLKKSTLRRDYILALKVLAFATSDGAVRKEALQQLVKIDSEGSLVVLGELAASEYPEVRRGAAKAIKSSTHFQATAEMKKLLTHDDPKTVLIAKEGLEARFRFFAKLPLGTIATLPTSDALIALQQRSKKTSKSTEVERILNQLKLREDFKAGAQSLFGPAFAEDPALQRFVLENVPPEMVAKMGYIAFLASSDPKIRDVGLKILINQKDLNSIAKGGGLTSRMMKEGPALDAVDAFTKIALTGEDEKIILHYLSQAIANAPRDQPWVMATLFPKIMMTAAKLSPAALADPYYGRVFTAEIITTLGASTPKKTLAAAAYFFKRGVQSTEVAGLENLARRVPELRPYVTSTLTAIATRNGTESCLTQALEAFAAGAP